MPTSTPILSNVFDAPVTPVTGRSILTLDYGTNTSTSNTFIIIGGDASNFDTTETVVDTTINFGFQATRINANVLSNASTVNRIFAFRDDGANVGAITIIALTSGQVNSGAITTNIATGSLCNWALALDAVGGTAMAGHMEYALV